MSARKPAVWPAWVSFFAAVATVIGSTTVVVAVAAGVWVASGKEVPAGRFDAFSQALIGQPWVFLSSTAATVLSIAMVALIAARIETRAVATRLRLHSTPRFWFIAGVGTVAMISTGQILESGVGFMGWGADSALAALSKVTLESSPATFAGLLLIGSLGAGIGEELLFRGYIQPPLVARWGRWPGILITAALFGAMHMDYLHSPIAFAIGVGLGWIADRFGSTRPTIVIHVLNNLSAFGLGRLGWLTATEPSGHLMLALGAVPVAVACWIALTRVRWDEPAVEVAPLS